MQQFLSLAKPRNNREQKAHGFGAWTANNGNVMSTADNVQGINYAYNYDKLNRIETAAATGGQTWGLAFTYDRYGNLLNQTVTAGTAPPLNVVVNAQNRITDPAMGYDAAGNMTNDGSHDHAFDAENRLKTLDTTAASYAYNPEGRRVKKTVGGTTTTYYPEASGQGSGSVLSEYVNGAWAKDYIYLGGQLLATESAAEGTRYHFADHLGTPRVISDPAGTVISRHDYYPFGQERTTWTDGESHKFTGQERDAESGLDYFIARHYANNFARFLQVDPSRLSVDITNPQTWNRYAYTLNNPLAYVDPNGKWPEWFHHDVNKQVFGDYGEGAVQALNRGSDWVDSLVNQSTFWSFMHSMSDGDARQKADEAERLARDYWNTELNKAVELQIAYEAQGGQGYSEEAMDHLGRAVHTVVDATSPEHEGFQPWYGLNSPSSIGHWRREKAAARSSEGSAQEARYQALVAARAIKSRFEQRLDQRRKEEEEKRKQKEARKKKRNAAGGPQ